jgi:hypothetical protein
MASSAYSREECSFEFLHGVVWSRLAEQLLLICLWPDGAYEVRSLLHQRKRLRRSEGLDRCLDEAFRMGFPIFCSGCRNRHLPSQLVECHVSLGTHRRLACVPECPPRATIESLKTDLARRAVRRFPALIPPVFPGFPSRLYDSVPSGRRNHAQHLTN